MTFQAAAASPTGAAPPPPLPSYALLSLPTSAAQNIHRETEGVETEKETSMLGEELQKRGWGEEFKKKKKMVSVSEEEKINVWVSQGE